MGSFLISPPSNIYNNIVNIVNENDLVPKVVMNNWGYERYGINKYLPIMNVPSKKKYNELKEKMLKNYAQYKKGEYLIDDFSTLKLVSMGASFIWADVKTNEGIFFDHYTN